MVFILLIFKAEIWRI